MRHTSAGLYAVVIVCFFLPWFQVSCGLFQLDISAYHMFVGEFEGNFTSSEDIRDFLEDQKNGHWWLLFVPIASAAGIVLTLVGVGRLVHVLFSLGCVGIALGEYAYLRNELFSVAAESGEMALASTLVRFEPAHGFWLTVVLGGVNALIVKTFALEVRHRSVQKQTGSIEFDPVSPPVKAPPKKSLKEQAKDVRRTIRANQSK